MNTSNLLSEHRRAMALVRISISKDLHYGLSLIEAVREIIPVNDFEPEILQCRDMLLDDSYEYMHTYWGAR